MKSYKQIKEQINEAASFKNMTAAQIEKWLKKNDTDEPGISPAFGMQLKAARAELKRKKLMKEDLGNYYGDDMTHKELRIACNAANEIIDMLKNGETLHRWQISAIVKASEELSSVYVSMKANEEVYDDDQWYDDEDEVVGYEYPWMGEEVELEESIGDYSSKKTGETKRTLAHPDGKPIFNILYKGKVIGTIKPYSATIDKKKPGARIVSSRREATRYSIDFIKDLGPRDVPVYSALKHTSPKAALEAAARIHEIWLIKNESLNEDKIKVGDIVKPSKSSTKTMRVTAIERVPYMGRKETFVDGIDDQGQKIRRPLKSVIKEGSDVIAESEDSRKKVIGDAIKKYASDAGSAKEIRGVSVDKIIDAFASKKTYGNKAIDELESELGLPVGIVMRLIAKVKENLKLNYNVKATAAPTQAQRIGSYLKQKHIGPRK